MNTASKLIFKKTVVTDLKDSLMQQINSGSALNDVTIQLTILLINS